MDPNNGLSNYNFTGSFSPQAGPIQPANTTIPNPLRYIQQSLPSTYSTGSPILDFFHVPQAYASSGGDVQGANTQATNNSGVPGLSSNQNISNVSFGAPSTPPTSDFQKLSQIAAAGQLNPKQQTDYNNMLMQQAQSAAQKAAQDQYNAENSRLNTQFDQSASQLQNQLGYLGTQKDSSLAQLEQAYTDAQNQAGTSRQNAQTNTDQQIDQAGSIAHSTQLQNRNVLRALGIGNSSYAGELLTQPITEFDKQRANLNVQLGQRFSELDNFLNSQAAQHAQAVKDLQGNYANLVDKIQTDLRFNDRQRNDALQAANAALSSNLANVQNSMLNYQQQVQLQKQNMANDLTKIMAYTNPSIAQNYLSQFQLTNPTNQTLGANIWNPQQQQKDQNNLSGLGQ